MILKSLNEFFKFLKNPKIQKLEGVRNSVLTFIILTSISFLVGLFLNFIIQGIANIGFYELYRHSSYSEGSENYNYILSIILIVPIIEEILFRLPLKISKLNFSISLIVLTILILIKYNFAQIWGLLIFLFILISLIFFHTKFFPYLRDIWLKYYKIVFYLVTLIFGLIHISNYSFSSTILFLTPILILPQLLSGILLGYFRLKIGFGAAVFYHCLWNGFFLVMFMVSNQYASLDINMENNKYKLEVYEVSDVNNQNESLTLSRNKIEFENQSLKMIISTLSDSDISKVYSNKPWINKVHLSGQFLNLNHQNNIKENKVAFLHELKMAYDFQIEKKTNNMDEIEIVEKTPCLSNQNVLKNENGNSKIKLTKDTIFYYNISISKMIQNLNNTINLKPSLFTNLDEYGKHNFKIPLESDSEKIIEYLENNYCLKTEKVSRKVETNYVIFN